MLDHNDHAKILRFSGAINRKKAQVGAFSGH